MSSSESTPKAGATFLWVLGAFAGFAVLFSIIQAVGAGSAVADPRSIDREAARKEIVAAQDANLTAMGLKDPAKKAEAITKSLAALKAKAVGVSTQVVPGSPTQLKQAAAAAPAAPAAAAPATAPAAPAPAPAPAK
ncbi:MAG: hypothetical protein IPK32_22395 [Verrucomicrobiaceae bacterium]|nr:hypothetical protein [Verrucomicrobiaceae bacterium]